MPLGRLNRDNRGQRSGLHATEELPFADFPRAPYMSCPTRECCCTRVNPLNVRGASSEGFGKGQLDYKHSIVGYNVMIVAMDKVGGFMGIEKTREGANTRVVFQFCKFSRNGSSTDRIH